MSNLHDKIRNTIFFFTVIRILFFNESAIYDIPSYHSALCCTKCGDIFNELRITLLDYKLRLACLALCPSKYRLLIHCYKQEKLDLNQTVRYIIIWELMSQTRYKIDVRNVYLCSINPELASSLIVWLAKFILMDLLKCIRVTFIFLQFFITKVVYVIILNLHIYSTKLTIFIPKLDCY